MDLSEKVVLITGGASGMGLATAKEFLKYNIKGMMLLDINSTAGEKVSKELTKENANVVLMFIKTDVGDENHVRNAYIEAKNKFGHVDIVVNAAGIYNDKKWQQEIHVNLIGVINSTVHAIECMRTDKGGVGGVIVNIASIIGVIPTPLVPMYSATKFAVQGMSRCFGNPIYEAKTGVKVVVVCPGVTNSDMYSNDILKTVFDDLVITQADLKEHLQKNKLQTVEEAAKGIVKAAVDGEAGAVWFVDGGEAKKMEISFSEKK